MTRLAWQAYGALATLGLVLGACSDDPRFDVTQEPARGPVQSSPIAVDRDGASVWVVNPDSNTVGRIDAATATLIDEIGVGENPRTLALRDLRQVFVANQDSDSLSRIDQESGASDTMELPFGSGPYGVAVSPNGEMLVVTLERTDQVLIVDPDRLAVQASIPVPRTPRGIAINTEGTRAYISPLHYICPGGERYALGHRPRGRVVAAHL